MMHNFVLYVIKHFKIKPKLIINKLDTKNLNKKIRYKKSNTSGLCMKKLTKKIYLVN